MAAYAVTYKDGVSEYITPGKRYRVLEERDQCFDIKFDNGTTQTGRWDKCAHLGMNEGWIRIDTNDGRATLRPGDYVSTEDMTEETYHAVARAFMAAGAGSAHFNRFVLKRPMSAWKFIGWGEVTGNLNGENSLRKTSRHLTISQVLNATNAGNEEKDMTPCEKLGYKVGDRFVANGAAQFSDGSIVELYRDDGSSLPLWKLISGHCKYRNADKKPGAYDPVKYFEKIGESHTLTQALRDAAEHDEKAKHHVAEHDRLMQRARDMLPDGWRLVRDGEPNAGMDDPSNWREGDVVECVDDEPHHCHKGGLYIVNRGAEFDRLSIKFDDDGDAGVPPLDSFRFHHRPT